MGWAAVNQRGPISPSLRRSASNFGRGPISSYPDGRRRRRETRREGKDLPEGNVRDGLAHGKRDHREIFESRVVKILTVF